MNFYLSPRCIFGQIYYVLKKWKCIEVILFANWKDKIELSRRTVKRLMRRITGCNRKLIYGTALLSDEYTSSLIGLFFRWIAATLPMSCPQRVRIVYPVRTVTFWSERPQMTALSDTIAFPTLKRVINDARVLAQPFIVHDCQVAIPTENNNTLPTRTQTRILIHSVSRYV
jgi:hypothetical protein